MKDNKTNSIHPLILIGTGLLEMYDNMDAELKKTVAITSGIDDSNLRACLNSKRNVCKNTLRKLATGLDVYPVLFFIPSKNINSDYLEYDNREGIAKIDNFDRFLELIGIPQQKTDDNAECYQLFNEHILKALDNLFEKIRLAKKNNLSEKAIKHKIIKAIINLTASLLE